MKIVNGKIVEATDDELFNHYLAIARDWKMAGSYPDYKRRCKEAGTKIADGEDEP